MVATACPTDDRSACTTSALASSATTPEAKHRPSNAAVRMCSALNLKPGSFDAAESAQAARVSSADARGSSAEIAVRTPSRRELFVLLAVVLVAWVVLSVSAVVALRFAPTPRFPVSSATSAASTSAVSSAEAVWVSRFASCASGSNRAAALAARTSGSSPLRYCRISFTFRFRPSARSRSTRRRRSAADAKEETELAFPEPPSPNVTFCVLETF
mmetsp:Transcript_13217/g.49416  ORF Transcript_13217/g.49416 Transcript_13217/m.49416 type:complete len:215 (-) Transcript_13217:292-936(-)